ncbi:SatD family protein [Cryomorphaceae bacterium 1068]|nr:SatD family protein [Cryomorphaceae bacterium 1068]
MIAIITGDIINSTEDDSTQWLSLLKKVLNRYGKSPERWEIFRGDSFQLEVEPKNALLTAFHIKACIKQTGSRDVRMAIGIGEATHKAARISESNGSAYVRSGESFEELKKQTLAIRTENEDIDETINLMLQLALLIADNWSSAVATIVNASIENPDKPQKELAKLLNKSQSSVSEAMSRGGYGEMMKVHQYYSKRIDRL